MIFMNVAQLKNGSGKQKLVCTLVMRSFQMHDDISVLMPNSIVNRLLNSHLELAVIPESDEVDEMFEFDIESESEDEDNSSACIVAAFDENIAAQMLLMVPMK